MARIWLLLPLVCLLSGLRCSHPEPTVDPLTARVRWAMQEALERDSGLSLTRIRLRPLGENRFAGTATSADAIEYELTAFKEGGALRYEARSRVGARCYSGTDTHLIVVLVAKKDIPAGTVIGNALELFEADGDFAAPKDCLRFVLWGQLPALDGKVVKNELKAGQRVWRSQIGEPGD